MHNKFIAGIAGQFESKAQAQAAFKSFADGIAAIFKAADSLKIKGFGTFKGKERAARKGGTPATTTK